MAKVGKKSMYETKIKPNLNLIEKWAFDGVTEETIRKRLGVGKTTFYKYKGSKPELRKSLSLGREQLEALAIVGIRKHLEIGDKEMIKHFTTHKMGWQTAYQKESNNIRRQRNDIQKDTNIVQTRLFERVIGDEPEE